MLDSDYLSLSIEDRATLEEVPWSFRPVYLPLLAEDLSKPQWFRGVSYWAELAVVYDVDTDEFSPEQKMKALLFEVRQVYRWLLENPLRWPKKTVVEEVYGLKLAVLYQQHVLLTSGHRQEPKGPGNCLHLASLTLRSLNSYQ